MAARQAAEGGSTPRESFWSAGGPKGLTGGESVCALLDERAASRPDAVALVVGSAGGHVDTTYAQLRDRATTVARHLTGTGRGGAGVPVAWALGNDRGTDAIVLYHAVLRTGGVNVPVNPRLAPGELEHLLGHVGARTLIVDADNATRIGALAGIEVVLVDDVLRPASPAAGPLPASVDPDQLASVLYTSGTTGLPKGVEHTHRSSLAAGIAWAECFGLGESDVLQSPFPVVSGAGLHFNALSSMWAGGTIALDDPSGADTFRLIEELRTTVYVAVPSIYQYWLANPQLDAHDLSSLRVLDYGGAAMAPAVIEALRARIPGVALMQTYGFTEAGPGGTYLDPKDTDTRPGSIGRRAAGRASSFKVVDADGAEVRAGEVGELWFRGPSVMRGYHRDPAATADVMRGEWIRSGDQVRVDADGYTYFVGRSREIIVRGGYNISPIEIEDALLRHDAVLEAAALGVPHPSLGEVPCAAIVLRPGTDLDLDELREQLRHLLADFKIPRDIRVVAALPKNPAGKTQKHLLRDDLFLPSNQQS